MYSFTMNTMNNTSSSACREEAASACPQRSVNIIAIVVGISVLVSIFAIIGILNIVRISHVVLCIIAVLAAGLIKHLHEPKRAQPVLR